MITVGRAGGSASTPWSQLDPTDPSVANVIARPSSASEYKTDAPEAENFNTDGCPAQPAAPARRARARWSGTSRLPRTGDPY
jgi:hypothetical protein